MRVGAVAIGLVAAVAVTASARADKKPAAPAGTPAWLGLFHPLQGVGCAPPSCLLPGVVRVFSPDDGSAEATGDVIVVHPLSGVMMPGRIDRSTAAIAAFRVDPARNAEDLGVLVVPASAKPVIGHADQGRGRERSAT